MNHQFRWMAFALLILLPATCRADIYRWDNGQLIPGTEGIAPGPGVDLSGKDLNNAHLAWQNLSGANLSLANLTNAWLESSTLLGANFAGAIVTGTSLGGVTDLGFTREQLYSTASYQTKNLERIQLGHNGLRGWDFSGQNLTGANLSGSFLDGANLSNANLTNSALFNTRLTNADLSSADLTQARMLSSELSGADLAGAIIKGSDLGGTTRYGFTAEQLHSTASYQAKDLQATKFTGNDLSGWNFREQNLTGAGFHAANLVGADLTGAIVAGANFSGSQGFTREQLYLTASYQTKNLQKMWLFENDLSSWDFSGQDLSGARFEYATLTGANFADARINGASLGDGVSGFTKEQLYQTASYKAHDLSGTILLANLSGWDFRDQNLAGAHLGGNLVGADLTGAIVNGMRFGGTNLTKEQLYTTGSYQTNDLRGMSFWTLGGFWSVIYKDLTGWDFSGQDLRHTIFNSDGVLTRNSILFDGTIDRLELLAGESFVIRDDDGSAPIILLGSSIPRPPTAINIRNHATLAEGSVLQLLFEADPWDSLISFEPGIPIELGGALQLTFADEVDVAAQVGRTLQVFNWTGVTPAGRFAIQSPYDWDTTQLYSTGEITLRAVPEPSAASIVLASLIVFAASRAPRRRLRY